MPFPIVRPRRLRSTASMRALVREVNLAPRDFVWPLFFSATVEEPRPIGTMPGVFQLPVSAAARVAREATDRGLGAVLLFGLPKTKDPRGSSGLDPNGPVPRAVAVFLSENNLAGKTLAPFCTHEGSHLGQSVEDIRKLCPQTSLLDGLAIRGRDAGHAQGDVSAWLRKLAPAEPR